MTARYLVASILVMSASAGMAAPADPAAVPVVAPQVVLEPVEAQKVSVFDIATGEMKEVYWASLPEAQKKSLLNSAEAFVQLAQVDTTGKISLLPLSASSSKGRYQLMFRWQQYRTEACKAAQSAAGRMRIGVGLEIIADITNKKNGVNLVNLGPLSISADKGDVQGSITIRQIGLGSSSPTLGTYLTRFDLTRDGVIKALEAVAVTKAVLENDKTVLTPHYLSITESSPGSCTSNLPVNVKVKF